MNDRVFHAIQEGAFDWFDTFEEAIKHLQGERYTVNISSISKVHAEECDLMVLGYKYIQGFDVKALDGRILGYVTASERSIS